MKQCGEYSPLKGYTKVNSYFYTTQVYTRDKTVT